MLTNVLGEYDVRHISDDPDIFPLVVLKSSASAPLEPIYLPRVEVTFPEMWPPGDILYLKPLTQKRICCGICCVKNFEWGAEWADPADVQQEFILSMRNFELHAPWVYEDAIARVAGQCHVGAGSAQRERFTGKKGGRRSARDLPTGLPEPNLN